MKDSPFNTFVNRVFEPDNPELISMREKKLKRKVEIAKQLGVYLYVFDNEGIPDNLLFQSAEEKAQYQNDKYLLSKLLDEDKDLPSDLVSRLLKIKERREQLEKKKNK